MKRRIPFLFPLLLSLLVGCLRETAAPLPAPTVWRGVPSPTAPVSSPRRANPSATLTSIPTGTRKPEDTPTPSATPLTLRFTLIGDSILAEAQPLLAEALGPQVWIDAQVGRTMEEAPPIIQRLAAQGCLAPTVLIHLGTNRLFEPDTFDQVMALLRRVGAQRVIFLTVKRPVDWETEVNKRLAAGVARWPEAELADWRAYAAPWPGWFAADGVHLTLTGREAYARFVLRALGVVPLPTETPTP